MPSIDNLFREVAFITDSDNYDIADKKGYMERILKNKDKWGDLKEKTKDLTSEVLEAKKVYDDNNGLLGIVFFKTHYGLLSQLHKELMMIESILTHTQIDKEPVYANVLHVISKSRYTSLFENIEKMTLKTLGLNEIDPIHLYNELCKYIIKEYENKKIETSLPPFEFVALDIFLSYSNNDFTPIAEKNFDDLGAEEKCFLTNYLWSLQKIFGKSPECFIKRYCGVLEEIFKLFDTGLTLHNVNENFPRRIHSLEKNKCNPSYKKIVKVPWDEEIKFNCKTDIFRKFEMSEDWSKLVPDVLSYFKTVKEGYIDFFNISKFEIRPNLYGQNSFVLKPTRTEKISLEQIVGCDTQIGEVESAVDAFLAGEDVRFIGLVGRPGIGKTMTMKALANKKDIKIVLLGSRDLKYIDSIFDIFENKNYPVLLYVDDLKLDGMNTFDWENLSKRFDGVEEFPKNILVAFSTNDKFYKTILSDKSLLGRSFGVPESILNRTQVVVYDFDFKKYYDELFDKLCEKHNIVFKNENEKNQLKKQIRKETKLFLKGIRFQRRFERNPRGIEKCLLALDRKKRFSKK